jgi:hypothetical protein
MAAYGCCDAEKGMRLKRLMRPKSRVDSFGSLWREKVCELSELSELTLELARISHRPPGKALVRW